jgi:hypothetical protein
MSEQHTLPRILVLLCSALSAQQPTPYLFKTLVSTGANIGGTTLASSAVIDGIALSDTGDVAFVARWPEGAKERTAVFTSRHFIARDGDTLDGKFLTRINATALAINNEGQVAFEALYGNPGQTGIFIGRKFNIALSTAGADTDFLLSDDGKVVLKTATAAAAKPATPRSGATTANNSIIPPGVLALRIPRSLQKVLQRPDSPIGGIDPNVLLRQQRTPPLQRAQQTPPPQAKSAPATPAHACTLPEFPYPPAWQVGDIMLGPIASHFFDAPAKARTYESRFFGPMGTPFRVIQFSSDCKALFIVLGDNFLKGRFELWTPNGLLTHTKDNGFLALDGFSGNVLPGALVRTEPPLRINRHGQIAMSVNIEPEGYAILLATPSGH